MEINVRGKNSDVNPALRQYAEKRLSKIEKYLRQSPLTCQVTLSLEREEHVVEVTIPLNGVLLRAEERNREAFSAVDNVVEKLEKQIEKYKTKIQKRDKADIPIETRYGDEQPSIVRVKRFAIKPMSAEEAATQMDLLGHDFFVFANADTGDVNVVYKRKDGNYGLIEPE